MKKLLCIIPLLLLASALVAQAPNFDYPYLLTNSAGYIVQGNVYTIPATGDWDDDGIIDLMVGVFYSGNIQYYHNSSTTTIPSYDPFVLVMADGSPISVTYG
jgi:hypothetical protein